MRRRRAQVSNPIAIDALPPGFLRAVFQALPADQRARCACVSRAWRALLADPALWLRLDISGLTCRFDEDALLFATERARGRLEVLNIDRLLSFDEYVDVALTVHAVAEENAASLREIRGLCFDDHDMEVTHGVAELQELLALAPALEVLQSPFVETDCLTAARLLRHDPPFGPLRMDHLTVVRNESEADFRAMVAELTTHGSLTQLQVRVDYDVLDEAPLSTDELELVVDAALTGGFKTLQICDCGLTPAAAPALVRLLSSAALTKLHLENSDSFYTLLDAPGYALLANALRGNRTLRDLALKSVIWLDVANEVGPLFDALTGHASLRCLNFNSCYLGHADDENRHLAGAELRAAIRIFGRAIGLLVAANAPALEQLRISFREAAGANVFGPLADALPGNTHLQLLEFEWYENNVGEAFMRRRLLPALRANTSLRKIDGFVSPNNTALAEAVQLINLREAARVAAEAAA